MPSKSSILTTTAVVLTILMLLTDGLAKGTFRFEDRYNPDHIASLPPEIRQTIIGGCREPRALHDFMRYEDGMSRIVLRYEHLMCGLSHIHCTAAGCLHQIYVKSSQGHYKLLRGFYVAQPEGEHF